ncbi:hypothetical protein PENTCL1PPCAC_23602, partial [Pristionchus entomophagus]
IICEASIIVKGENGNRFRKKPPPNFFTRSEFSDVIFSVGGKKIYVNKQMLAHASPYFEALFFGDFKESREKEIVLDDVSTDEFLTLLELIYDYGKIDDINVEYVLQMADRFDIPKIMISAEEYLHDHYFPLHLKLRLSDQYSFYTLQ